MKKSDQIKLLLKCVSLLASAKAWPDATASYYWDLVKHAHKNGWLYVGFNGEDIDVMMVVYRVKDVTDETLDTLPEKEEGDIFYVLTAVSKSSDRTKLTKMKKYILSNNPDVKKVALHHRWDKTKLRIFEVNHGKTVQA